MSSLSLFATADQRKTAAKDFQFSYEVDGPSVAGEGKPRRSYTSVGELPSTPNDVLTLHDNLLHGHSISRNEPFLGKRTLDAEGKAGPYEFFTYDQILKRVTNLGSALVKRGHKPGSHIGLYSQNNVEWVVGEHACFKYDYVTVPLYDTLGEEAIEHILNLCEIPVVLCTKDKSKILYSLQSKLPSLTTIVIMDGLTDAIKKVWANSHKINVVAIEELEKEGALQIAPRVKTNSDSIATVCFTSGTTGLPKGALLSHGNLLSFAAGALQMIKNGQLYNFSNKDSYVSYLPLAHIFERVVQVFLTYLGAKIGFFQGDTLKLMDDLAALKPTIFVSVPRLYNRIYDKVLAGVKATGGMKEMLFNFAFNAKKSWMASGHIRHILWDRIVFGKIRERLGGNVQFMMTGAAPISKDVMEFLRICFSCPVVEGYGQTECTAGLTTGLSIDLETGNVGVPMPQNMVKLRDVPSMNYYSTDKPFPRGEICTKGNNVFKGYYKQPEKTAEALSSDGWLYTGDVGYWDQKGRLVIIDRVKNIFKLAQGEYIAPEKIENVYTKHPLIAQAFIHGDSLQSTLVGILVPDRETVVLWAKENGFIQTDIDQLFLNPEFLAAVQKSLNQFAKENGLKGFEIAKDIHFEMEMFSVENNLLTPSFKLKRNEAKVKYQAHINRMYAENK